MKKVFFVASLVLTFTAFAQTDTDNSWFGTNSQQENTEYSTDSTDPGGMGEPVPINSAIPALVGIGFVLSIWLASKELLSAKK